MDTAVRLIQWTSVVLLLQATGIVTGVAIAQESGPSSAATAHVPTITRPAQFALSERLRRDERDAANTLARTPNNERIGQSDSSIQPRIQFDGLSANGASDGLSDVNIAVGPRHIVQMVNSEYAVYDKQGRLQPGYPLRLGTIWQALGSPCDANGADPIVQYDRLADRWLLSQALKDPAYFECIAISMTDDPGGRYALYAYDFGSTLSDWPKFGVWPTIRNSAYLATYNLFELANTYVGTDLCAYDRAAMLTADPRAAQVCFTNVAEGTYPANFLPADLDGSTIPPAGSPAFFANLGPDSLNVFKLTPDFVDPARSTLVGPTTLDVEPFVLACGGINCIPQLGTANTLVATSDRLMSRLAYRRFPDHEALVASHAVDASRSVGIRWYELRDPAGDTQISEHGTFAPDRRYRWMGSGAFDKSGNMALGYNVSSADVHPGIAYTTRLATDPPGVMAPETVLVEGGGSQTAVGRWSDASSMRVDPSDDCTFWYTTQYLKSDGSLNWTTDVSAFGLQGCMAQADFSLSADRRVRTVHHVGSVVEYRVAVQASNGFDASVRLTIDGLPEGVSASMPHRIDGSGSVVVRVAIRRALPPGPYVVAVTGTVDGVAHSTDLILIVH
jgi:hypothetical protein